MLKDSLSAEPALEMHRLIEKKRDGAALGAPEWERVVASATNGSADFAQLGALLMACVLSGMNHAETVALTQAMVNSGEVVRFTHFDDAVDKHSTGGVGDTASLIVVPVLAACGLRVAKLSGRALGHTGGTIDKLETIPGFRVDLDAPTFERIIATVGCSIAAQSHAIVPADKVLYSLRDRTATIPSVGLITASIVSKKIAGGAKDFAFDVKVGSGAFMKTIEQARVLAASLMSVAGAFGHGSVALITDMNEPLSPMIGNALEIIAARDFLAGTKRWKRLETLVRALATALLEMRMSPAAAAAGLDRVLAGNAALEKFKEMISAQGGDVDAFLAMQPAAETRELRATQEGYISSIDTAVLGHVARAAIESGGANAGVQTRVCIGDAVRAGDLLAIIYGAPRATQELERAFTLSSEAPAPQPVVYETITGDSSILSIK